MVLVTGAQRGIGRATIIEFARHGYNVVIDYYEEEERAFALKRCVEEQYGIRALPISADISNEADVDYMVDNAIK